MSRSISRSSRGDNRFYNPPAVRRYQQQQQLQLEQQRQKQQQQQQQQGQIAIDTAISSSVESDKRAVTGHECASQSSGSVAVPGGADSTNLDRFLEYTTPVVQAQVFPKTSIKGWRISEAQCHPYFLLGDLWESFGEWSAYGAGVPLLLNGKESVVQYYVPYLSGIQLYIDSSRPSPRLRRPGEESDTDFSRETSSDGSSDCGAEANGIQDWSLHNIKDVNIQFNSLSLRNKPFKGSSSDEGEFCSPPGKLVFEYLERTPPFNREPLADKIAVLASRFPELRTYRSCDLSPSSWISVAWYPIYRIPTGPTLQNLDACFLTFHSLSTSSQNTRADSIHVRGSSVWEDHSGGMPSKLSLPIFGLAFHKFKVAEWNSSGAHQCQKANSLLRAADNWLKLLQVSHPDYRQKGDGNLERPPDMFGGGPLL